MSTTLAIVPGGLSTATATDDSLTPAGILRTLGAEIAAAPFATGKRAAAVRQAGTALHAAMERVGEARRLVIAAEAEAAKAADKALQVLTGG